MRIDNYNYVVKEEYAPYLATSDGKNLYKVVLGTGLANTISFFCANFDEADAIDATIDYCEKHGNMFVYTHEELAKNLDVVETAAKNEDIFAEYGYICGGNSGLYANVIFVEKLDEYPEFMTIDAEEFIKYLDWNYTLNEMSNTILKNVLRYVSEHFEYNYDKKVFFEKMISETEIDLNDTDMSICKEFRNANKYL